MTKDNIGRVGMLAGLIAMIGGGYGKHGVSYGENIKFVGTGKRKVEPIYDKIVCPKCSGKLKRVCKSPRKYICKNILCGFKHIGKLSNIKREGG